MVLQSLEDLDLSRRVNSLEVRIIWGVLLLQNDNIEGFKIVVSKAAEKTVGLLGTILSEDVDRAVVYLEANGRLENG